MSTLNNLPNGGGNISNGKEIVTYAGYNQTIQKNSFIKLRNDDHTHFVLNYNAGSEKMDSIDCGGGRYFCLRWSQFSKSYYRRYIVDKTGIKWIDDVWKDFIGGYFLSVYDVTVYDKNKVFVSYYTTGNTSSTPDDYLGMTAEFNFETNSSTRLHQVTFGRSVSSSYFGVLADKHSRKGYVVYGASRYSACGLEINDNDQIIVGTVTFLSNTSYYNIVALSSGIFLFNSSSASTSVMTAKQMRTVNEWVSITLPITITLSSINLIRYKYNGSFILQGKVYSLEGNSFVYVKDIDEELEAFDIEGEISEYGIFSDKIYRIDRDFNLTMMDQYSKMNDMFLNGNTVKRYGNIFIIASRVCLYAFGAFGEDRAYAYENETDIIGGISKRDAVGWGHSSIANVLKIVKPSLMPSNYNVIVHNDAIDSYTLQLIEEGKI